MDKIVNLYSNTYKYFRLILLDQWIGLNHGVLKNNIPIITIDIRTHNDLGIGWTTRFGGGFQNPNQLIDQVDYIIWIDSGGHTV